MTSFSQWPAAHSSSSDGSTEELRTIFILGFPPDVKERELQNLLRWWPGYEASQLNLKGEQPMGFALFSSRAVAMAARDALQNLVFDVETNSVLRAEMAKKNLVVKAKKSDGYAIGAPSPFSPGGTPFPPFTPQPTAAAVFGPALSAWGLQSFVPPLHYEPGMYGMYHNFAPARTPLVPVPLPLPAHSAVVPTGYAPVQNMKDNPPCNTLFIGNLGEMTSEVELRGLFSSQPGFRQMKVLRTSTGVLCFVEFSDLNAASEVHKRLQGAIIASSDRGPMRIQYSKNPFGTKPRSAQGSSHSSGANLEAFSNGVNDDSDNGTSGLTESQDGLGSSEGRLPSTLP